MTGPEGNSEFCFPRISMFPETKSRETLRFEEVEGNIEIRGKQNSLFPKGPVIKWFVIWQNKTQKQNLKTALRFQPSLATAVNNELLTG